SQSLRHWRVPHASTFYFDDEEVPERVANAMRRVLMAIGGGPPTRTPAGELGRALLDTTAQLAAAAEVTPIDVAAAPHASAACSSMLRRLVSDVPDWPDDFGALLMDRRYHRLLPSLGSLDRLRDGAGWDVDVATHLAHLLGQWENSNLHKYLVLATRAG